MSLPPRESIYPEHRLLYAAITWGRTVQVCCPTCREPALVGYLDGAPVAYSCHRCGPIGPSINLEQLHAEKDRLPITVGPELMPALLQRGDELAG